MKIDRYGSFSEFIKQHAHTIPLQGEIVVVFDSANYKGLHQLDSPSLQTLHRLTCSEVVLVDNFFALQAFLADYLLKAQGGPCPQLAVVGMLELFCAFGDAICEDTPEEVVLPGMFRFRKQHFNAKSLLFLLTKLNTVPGVRVVECGVESEMCSVMLPLLPFKDGAWALQNAGVTKGITLGEVTARCFGQ
ncbi:hypothetical protein BABINDRAFT_133785 [Babjeviella inositovora NRRL Y-12698]|uniref:Uncharacterized protein n=1 Tax=Babjeviella inositovora NRRL Y-12698 TaxID=984486 RepID=A0A1E3QTX4_9ASCO|nr:uncharacterized protein BABINDRAFT_133785 [Babjeviella inositovora NRRL Y-12698]ODQ80452.1 hypothetical protein BABINDRAFT_133785 [Babjeviella inositovora NRRL Y-12698]